MGGAKRSGRGGFRVGAGRKPKPEVERRRNGVTIKLTDGELAVIASAAGQEPVSSYVRRVVLAASRRRIARTR